MSQHLAAFTLLVPDYDEAITYFTEALGFRLLEDTDLGGGKRWVRVAPPGSTETSLLLARAASPSQIARIGDQGAGRVILFLQTDDFGRDYAAFLARGVRFTETPRQEAYGTVAVFADRWGNLWDLVERSDAPSRAASAQVESLRDTI